MVKFVMDVAMGMAAAGVTSGVAYFHVKGFVTDAVEKVADAMVKATGGVSVGEVKTTADMVAVYGEAVE